MGREAVWWYHYLRRLILFNVLTPFMLQWQLISFFGEGCLLSPITMEVKYSLIFVGWLSNRLQAYHWHGCEWERLSVQLLAEYPAGFISRYWENQRWRKKFFSYLDSLFLRNRNREILTCFWAENWRNLFITQWVKYLLRTLVHIQARAVNKIEYFMMLFMKLFGK